MVEALVAEAAAVSVGGGFAGRKIISVGRARDGGRGDALEIGVGVVLVTHRAPDKISHVGQQAGAVVGETNRAAQRVVDVRQLAGAVIGEGERVAVAIHAGGNLAGLRAAVERIENPLSFVRESKRENIGGIGHALPEHSGGGERAVGLARELISAAIAIVQHDAAGVLDGENVVGEIPAVTDRCGRAGLGTIGAGERKIRADTRNVEVGERGADFAIRVAGGEDKRGTFASDGRGHGHFRRQQIGQIGAGDGETLRQRDERIRAVQDLNIMQAVAQSRHGDEQRVGVDPNGRDGHAINRDDEIGVEKLSGERDLLSAVGDHGRRHAADGSLHRTHAIKFGGAAVGVGHRRGERHEHQDVCRRGKIADRLPVIAGAERVAPLQGVGRAGQRAPVDLDLLLPRAIGALRRDVQRRHDGLRPHRNGADQSERGQHDSEASPERTAREVVEVGFHGFIG